MIPFNRPPYTENEDQYVVASMHSNKMSGDGVFGKKCQSWFEQHLGCSKALLTPSCTHALEMSALLINVQPDDEVIMPSYTFVSTANAFVLRGAKIVFVDIRPDTMNLDETLIETAITPKTKAIVPVHYAGVPCEMDGIMTIAERYGLHVIEDAAQGMMSCYKQKRLGTFGHLGAYSFHETKNYTSGGEGGLLIINDEKLVHRAEIIREKGANRCQYFRGEVDKYSWVDVGSSYLLNDISAAYLWGQLEKVNDINSDRLASWALYYNLLSPLAENGYVSLPVIPDDCTHNGHMFYIKVKDLDERTALLQHLKSNGIMGIFHYVPLHSSKAGKIFGRFNGTDKFTTKESERLIRLPAYYGLERGKIEYIVEIIRRFYC